MKRYSVYVRHLFRCIIRAKNIKNARKNAERRFIGEPGIIRIYPNR